MASNYWLDFDNEMNMANDGDVATMSDVDAVYNSLRNIISTLRGSRRMLPEFAVEIHRLLFEPIDTITARKIADVLYGSIEIWESRIVVEGFEIIAYPDANLYVINLTFRIIGALNNQDTYTFNDILRAA